MTYTPNDWQDEILAGAELYNIKTDAGETLHSNVRIELSTSVAQAGSDVTAERMNHIEQGIKTVEESIPDVEEVLYSPGHLFGLTLSNNSTDPTNDIDISTGSCIDSTNLINMVLSAVLTKQINASWAEGTGQGGLDTGAVADGTYHVFLIRRSDTGVIDGLFSISATTPTMPSGYDSKRRIGSIVRSSGANRPFFQVDDHFWLKTPINDVTATNPGTSAVIRTLSVPTGISVFAYIGIEGEGTGAATTNPQGILVTELELADIAPTTQYCDIHVNAVSGGTRGAAKFYKRTNTSGQLRSRIGVSTASTNLIISTYGWIDTRGRLS